MGGFALLLYIYSAYVLVQVSQADFSKRSQLIALDFLRETVEFSRDRDQSGVTVVIKVFM